ncbi:MAG TPA: hypothetical protein VMJ35_12010 [Dongiaceae bacterium]|nr:hypothetical protein [Dongiaceae bacterium]
MNASSDAEGGTAEKERGIPRFARNDGIESSRQGVNGVARTLVAIARADFLERTRRYSFFLALLFAVFLGYATATGKVFIQFDEYRGVYTSGWIGTLVALTITCFVSLVGFYVVKNSVERDRATGVGQILAATPLSKIAYAFGKFLSNFAVLSTMVGVLAVAAMVMQFIVGEDSRLNLWALLSPFLLIALPTVALTAVVALFFEMVPWLRGGLGNVTWFFVWNFTLAAPIWSGRAWLDPMGLIAVMNTLGAQAKQYVPGYRGGMSFQIDVGQHMQVISGWRFAGIPWTVELVAVRLLWFGVACGIAVLAAVVFDRFDTAKLAGARKGKKAAAMGMAAQRVNVAANVAEPVHLTPLVMPARVHAFGRLFGAELRLMLFGLRWWWYAVAAGLLIAEFVAPLAASRGPLVASAWMWCVFVWSGMGARETRFETRGLLFSCANILPRQLLACWAAGVAVSSLVGAGAAVRLALAGDAAGMVGWLAGAMVLPSAALFLGVMSGTSKPFEGALTLAWYVGAINHTPGLDYTGAANGAHEMAYAVVVVTIAIACVIGACGVRARQLRSV